MAEIKLSVHFSFSESASYKTPEAHNVSYNRLQFHRLVSSFFDLVWYIITLEQSIAKVSSRRLNFDSWTKLILSLKSTSTTNLIYGC